MTGPLVVHGTVGQAAGFALALLVGVLFGFVLERAGFGSARKLAAVFYGRDMTVLKVMLTAIVTAAIGLQYLVLFGRLDASGAGVLATYLWSQLLGGLIFGVGFVLGGYCPGTAIVALVSGRKDALAFAGGLLVGTVLWGSSFAWMRELYGAGALGVVTLAQGLRTTPGVVALGLAVAALLAFRLAGLVEEGLRDRDAASCEEPGR